MATIQEANHPEPGDPDRTDERDQPLGIDELARRCGTTVRTIREYQTIGVLPPPRKQGRVAVYDDGHVARLRAVGRLEERGYSLAAIGDLLSAWETGFSLPAVLGLDDTPTIGAIDEQPVIVSAADLSAELPAVFGSRTMARRAVRAGLVAVVDDDRFAVRSPAFVQLVAELLEAGIPAATVLDLAESVSTNASAMAGPVADLVTDLLAEAPGGSLSPEGIQRVRRARLLLAQAAATMLIDRLGGLLNERSGDDPRLAALIEAVRVGQVRDATR